MSETKAQECEYCKEQKSHPFFVSLFGVSSTAAEEQGLGHPVSSRISVGRHPFKRQLEINGHFDQIQHQTKRKRKRGWPHLNWICSVGPFMNGKAGQFRVDWQRGSRKQSGRLAWAVQHCQELQYGGELLAYIHPEYFCMLYEQLQKHADGRSFLLRYNTPSPPD